MKKTLGWLLILALLLPIMSAAEIVAEDAAGERPETLYIGYAQTGATIRREKSREAEGLGGYRQGDAVEITGFDPEWLSVVKEDSDGTWVEGYVLRHLVDNVRLVAEDVLPYPCVPASYVATVAEDCMMYKAPGGGDVIFQCTEGMRLALISIENGWAKMIYWRQYAYVSVASLKDLEPVFDWRQAQSGDVIAAYTSFYNMADTEMNNNRKWNIKLCCEYISIPIEPGFRFSVNHIGGPYSYSRGYLDGIAFVNGEAVPSPGGGTCQVSSTLYNVLLALPDGITIVHRRPHGPSGATYLPHGADAAVGTEQLNLIFRNDFDFVIDLYAYPQDGALYIEMRKGDSVE